MKTRWNKGRFGLLRGLEGEDFGQRGWRGGFGI